VCQLSIGECPAFAVFEPFLADLVAADVEVPDLRRDTLKILCLVDVDALVIFIVAYLVHLVGAGNGVSGNEVIQRGRLHQVQSYQLGAFLYKGFEKPLVRGKRQARKVYLEELGVAGAVGG